MKKLLALLLAGVMVLSFAACSKNKNEESTTAAQTTTEATTKELTVEEKIVGEWKTTMDYTEKFFETKGIKEVKDKFKKDFKFAFDIHFIFDKDGGFKMEFDKDSLKKVKENIADNMEVLILESFRQTDKKYASYSDKQLKEEFKKSMGQDFDEYVKKMADEFDITDIADENLQGKYQIEKDKLYFSRESDKKPDKKSYLTYQFSGDDKFEVTEFVIDGEKDSELFITPFTLERIK
ncbi:MAG: hypothetical protein IKE65_06275 [Clostridia bacterium]|nr:hypothetical protein [Clostridia bacterium]